MQRVCLSLLFAGALACCSAVCAGELLPAPRRSQVIDESNVFSDWLPGPTAQWHIRMDTALAEARRLHRRIFVLKTGSNWCSWCKKLHEEVLADPKFTDLARRKLVLVYLDRPHGSVKKDGQWRTMPEPQSLYNDAVFEVLDPVDGFPRITILDEFGRKIGGIAGFLSAEQYISKTRELLAAKPQDRKTSVPGWMRKSPQELVPMLEERRQAKYRDAEDAAKASEIAKGRVSFEVIAWGLDGKNVDRPFDPKQEIRVPAGKRVFFRVRYHMPADMKAVVYLRMPNVPISGVGQKASGDGELVSHLTYSSPCRQEKIQMKICLLMKESRPVVAAELPCIVIWE